MTNICGMAATIDTTLTAYSNTRSGELLQGGRTVGENLILGYLPIFIFLISIFLLGAGMLIASQVFGRLAGRRYPTEEKNSTYECGMLPIKDARQRFDIRFYLVAMLFIVFDIEVVFMYPWAVMFNKFNPVIFGFVEMVIFIVILLFGYIYIWRKGALNWR
jgi:NADH-quinone oxidoreductase subunit A